MMKRLISMGLVVVTVLLCFSTTVGALSPAERYTQSSDIGYVYFSRTPYLKILKFMPNNKSVTIPAEFDGRPVAMFESCTTSDSVLTHIYVDEDNLFFADKDGIVYDHSFTMLVRVPPDRAGKISIPEGVTIIAKGAFYGCKNVTSISFPDSIKHIEYWAFQNCTG